MKTQQGWVYVAFVIDVFSRQVVGWQTCDQLYTQLALDALNMAICQRRRRGDDLTGLVHHSDRGVQYRSVVYTDRLAECAAEASVGSRGDCYDNALAEAFNSLYKTELIYQHGPWQGLGEVEKATAEYVSWFNTDRLHSSLGYATPTEAEDCWRKQQESVLVS